MKHGDRFKLHPSALEDYTLWIDADPAYKHRVDYPRDAIQPDDVWIVITDGDPIAGDCVIAVNERSGVKQCILDHEYGEMVEAS